MSSVRAEPLQAPARTETVEPSATPAAHRPSVARRQQGAVQLQGRPCDEQCDEEGDSTDHEADEGAGEPGQRQAPATATMAAMTRAVVTEKPTEARTSVQTCDWCSERRTCAA